MAQKRSPLQLRLAALPVSACLVLVACGERAGDTGVPGGHGTEAAGHGGDESQAHQAHDDGDGAADSHDAETHGDDADHDHDHDHDDEAGHDHDHDQASGAGAVHVHGAAEMSVAVSGDTLSLGLITPMANLGLSESEPGDDAARSALDAVREALADPATLFDIDAAAGCAPRDTSILFDFDGAHGEAVIDYTLACAGGVPDRLRFAGFTAYPGIEEVALVVITDAGMTAGTLSPGNAQVRLR